MNKCAIDFNYIIGQPYETCFEVVDRHTGQLQIVTDPRAILTKAFLEEFAVDEDDVAEGKDNREIGLSDSAQKMNQT